MSLHARSRLRGAAIKITRPAVTRDADGTRRAIATGETILYASELLNISPLTVERRTIVFGANSQATCAVRVPLGWSVQQDDQLTELTGAGRRFRVERRLDYTQRPRLVHTELALVQLAPGAA